MTTFPPSWVDPFPLIFLQKRGLRTGAPKNLSKFRLFGLFCKMCELWVPRGRRLILIFQIVFDGALFGPQGCPRAAPGLLFIDFGMDLYTF